MKTLDNLYEILEDELKKIAKKSDITPSELEGAYKAIDIMKDIETIKAMKEADFSGGNSNDYSQRGSYRGSYNSYDGQSMNRGSYGSYDGQSQRGSYNSYNNSYAPIWNQDMMRSMDTSYNSYNSYGSYDGRAGRDADNDGRYSEDGSYEYSRRRDSRGRYTSRDGSYEYSRHSEKERMIDKLETMADVTTDAKTRKAIEQCITKLEQQ